MTIQTLLNDIENVTTEFTLDMGNEYLDILMLCSDKETFKSASQSFLSTHQETLSNEIKLLLGSIFKRMKDVSQPENDELPQLLNEIGKKKEFLAQITSMPLRPIDYKFQIIYDDSWIGIILSLGLKKNLFSNQWELMDALYKKYKENEKPYSYFLREFYRQILDDSQKEIFLSILDSFTRNWLLYEVNTLTQEERPVVDRLIYQKEQSKKTEFWALVQIFKIWNSEQRKQLQKHFPDDVFWLDFACQADLTDVQIDILKETLDEKRERGVQDLYLSVRNALKNAKALTEEQIKTLETIKKNYFPRKRRLEKTTSENHNPKPKRVKRVLELDAIHRKIIDTVRTKIALFQTTYNSKFVMQVEQVDGKNYLKNIIVFRPASNLFDEEKIKEGQEIYNHILDFIRIAGPRNAKIPCVIFNDGKNNNLLLENNGSDIHILPPECELGTVIVRGKAMYTLKTNIDSYSHQEAELNQFALTDSDSDEEIIESPLSTDINNAANSELENDSFIPPPVEENLFTQEFNLLTELSKKNDAIEEKRNIVTEQLAAITASNEQTQKMINELLEEEKQKLEQEEKKLEQAQKQLEEEQKKGEQLQQLLKQIQNRRKF